MSNNCNVENRTIYCNDNLNILKGINNNCIDLIYLDPPFNSGRNYGEPRKSMAELGQFKDKWDEDDENIEWWFAIKEKHPQLHLYLKDIDDYANKSTQVYLTMMAVRVLEMHRILKDTGSLYYHCDQTAGHYIKVMLDVIFGKKNFRNEIVWCYRGAGYPKNDFGRRHDIIFRYSSTENYTFNKNEVRMPYAKATVARFKHKIGNVRDNKDYGQQKLHEKGRCPDDWWEIQPIAPSSKERMGYPTQKPLKLLERIIKASSNEGDMILDPFCGCATTCVAAEKLGRQWCGIDIWEGAHEIIGKRLHNDFALWEGGKIHKLSKPPIRTDTDPEHKQKRKREYIADDTKEMVWKRDDGRCRNCGATRNLQYDHIIPHSEGGSNEITNLQILCRDCNLKKSNKYHS